MITALLSLAAIGTPPLWIGWGESDLTPPVPLPLGGYTERRDRLMQPSNDRISARAITFYQGSERVALISVELLTVPRSLYLRVANLLPGWRVLLCATHTHSAPDSQMLNDRMTIKIPGIARYDEEWATWYSTRIAESVLRSDRPKVVQWMRTGSANVNANRSRRQDGSHRTQFTVVQLSDGSTLFTIGHFAAHPTVLGPDHNTVSGDWPGEWMRRARPYEKRLFVNGALGDVSPLPPSSAGGPSGVSSMAHVLSESRVSFRPAISRPQIQAADVEIALPTVSAHPEFATANGIPSVLAQSLVKTFAEPAGSVTGLRIGTAQDGTTLVFVPAEPTDAIGRKLDALCESALPGAAVTVSFANGWLGYGLTPDQYRKGGYEATLSFYGPDASERIILATRNVVEQLRSKGQTRVLDRISRPALFQSSRNRFSPLSVSGW